MKPLNLQYTLYYNVERSRESNLIDIKRTKKKIVLNICNEKKHQNCLYLGP